MGKIRTLTGKRLVEYNNGRFLTGVAQFALILLLYLDKYNLSILEKFLLIPVSIICTWFLGFIYQKSGLRKSFDEEAAKYTIEAINKKGEK